MATSYPKLRHLREQSRTMDVAWLHYGVVFLPRSEESIRLFVCAATPNLFAVLGARPLLGRLFREDENLNPLGHAVVILSEGLWRRRFDARPDIVGEKVALNGELFSVVGVLPRDFRHPWFDWRGLQSPEAWIPATMAPVGMLSEGWRHSARAIESPNTTIWAGIARLRPGHNLSEARAEAAIVGDQVKALWPELNDPFPVPFEIIPLSEEAIDPKILHAVFLLRAAGWLVLLLGGLNLGNLFLARGLERANTLGLQAVLGAPRLGLVWGALTEALFVGGAGGLLAVFLTRGALALLGVVEPTILTAPFGVTFDPAAWRADWPRVAPSLVLAATAALIFGLLPAWKTTRLDASALLRGGAGVTSGGLRRLRLTGRRGLLVAFETALALAVTLPALLLVRSLASLVTADLGFRSQGVATAELRLPPATYPPAAAAAFIDDAVRGLQQLPGVESASWVSCLPIECPFFTSALNRPGSPRGLVASVHVVAPDAFRTLGIGIRSGRDFGAEDRAEGPPVVILSERAARLLGGATPGSRVEVPVVGARSFEVVGTVADVPYRDLAKEPMPGVYFPLSQKPQTEGVLVVTSTTDIGALAGLVRRTVASLDPQLEVLSVTALAARVDRSVARFRGAAWLLGVASVLALFLTAVGIYGLLWSLVAQSVREIAIRIALGAAPEAIGRSISGGALRLAAVGLGAGAGLGSWGATYLRSYLYGVRPWDAQALLLTLAVTTGLAVLAAVRPARRASRVDPMVALRCE